MDTNANLLLNINVDDKSLLDLKKSFKDLQMAMSEAGRAGDKQLFQKLKVQSAQVKDAMSDLRAETARLSSDAMIQNFANLGQAMVAAYSAGSAAAVLFGVDEKSAAEITKKAVIMVQLLQATETMRVVLIEQGMIKIVAAKMKEAAAWAIANPYMTAAILAATALAAGMVYLSQKTDEETQAELINAAVKKDSIAATNNAIDAYSESSVKVLEYISILDDSTISEETKRQVLVELDTVMNTNLATLTDTNTAVQGALDLAPLYLKMLKDKAMATAFGAEVAKNAAEGLKLEESLSKIEEDGASVFADVWNKITNVFADDMTYIANTTNVKGKEIRDDLKKVQGEGERLSTTWDEWIKTSLESEAALTKAAKSLGGLGKQAKETATKVEVIRGEYQKLVDKITLLETHQKDLMVSGENLNEAELSLLATYRLKKKAIDDSLKEKDKEIGAYETLTKKISDTEKLYLDQLVVIGYLSPEQIKLLENLKAEKKAYDDILNPITTIVNAYEKMSTALSDYEKSLKAKAASGGVVTPEELAKLKKMKEELKAINGLFEDTKVVNSWGDDIISQIESVSSAFKTGFEAMNTIVMQSYKNRQINSDNYYNAEYEKMDNNYKNEIERAGDNADLKSVIDKNYSNKKAQLDEEKAKKEKEIRLKQARAEKDMAIFNATINLAEAISKALSGAPPPFNVALAAISAGLSAVQLAAIISQPLPTFATGGLVGGAGTGTSDSNLALVSKGEYVVNAQSTKQNGAAIESINNDGGVSLATMIGSEVAKQVTQNMVVVNNVNDTMNKYSKITKVKNLGRLR